jgi:hypothetical protein
VHDGYEKTVEFSLVARIATALRNELAGDMDEYPAHHDPDEAGRLNRAFRIMARTILSTIVPPSEEIATIVTWALNRIARQRIAEAGLGELEVTFLLGREPATRDDWIAFLILTSNEELRHVLRERGPSTEQP